MIEAEAKFDDDRAKVARVVYNRLAARISRSGSTAPPPTTYKVAGKDPTKATYRLAIQHPRSHRAAADADQQPGRDVNDAAVNPADGQLAVLRQCGRRRPSRLHQQLRRLSWPPTARCIKNNWGCL